MTHLVRDQSKVSRVVHVQAVCGFRCVQLLNYCTCDLYDLKWIINLRLSICRTRNIPWNHNQQFNGL